MALRLPRLRINRLWLTMIGAIFLGLLAAWLSVNYINTREARMRAELAQKAKGGPTVAVVVPVRDVPKGTVISQKVVAAREVVPDLLYDDTVTADQFDKIAGKRLLKPLLKGRPLRMSDVIDDHVKDLSDALGTGWRALTFDIDETKVRLDELGGAYSMTASVTKRTIKRVKLINHERNPLRRQVVIDPTAHMTMELLLDHGP